MLHTITKKGLRGFTLIELLVVIAIIGLLSTVIAAPIQNARKKARDAKKISELKALELALDQYAEANAGNYPDALASLAPTYMPVLPSYVSGGTGVATRDYFAYTRYQVSGSGISTQNFGYHLGSKLETYSQALDSDRDCLAGSQGTTLPAGQCVFYNATGATITGNFSSISSGIQAAATYPGTTGWAGTDFAGADGATTTCSSNADCIYDIAGQQ
jgi:prepilin-type N-terminal cleavage/methylation domain-containing protein